MSGFSRSVVGLGIDGVIIDIECHVSNNLPTIVIVGSAGRAVTESKDRLRGAFTSSGLDLPRRRITINLAPADIPKSDSGLDVAIAISILVASQQVMALGATEASIGELGLDGSVRPVRGIIGKLLAGRQHGITTFYVPLDNLEQAQLIPGLTLIPISTLRQLYEHLAQTKPITAVVTGSGRYDSAPLQPPVEHGLDDVIGQAIPKRALIIAAAGGHNILLTGPPGTGKSMLASTLPSLLPALSHEEILEVTHLSSLASNNYEQLVAQRPFRSPHHSASHVAMVGGGSGPRPGEISLSHRGVLFLDEFPEFDRATLEALRQPLEDHHITVSRAKTTVQFPANFMLVATANPCPCGFNGTTSGQCICSPPQLRRYQSKLSGPIMDRIDLCCDVHEVMHGKLLTTVPPDGQQIAAVAVAQARQLQQTRYGSPTLLNSSLTSKQMRAHAALSAEATSIINTAAARLNLSARGYLRVIKVARTIADLADSPAITTAHITEAIAYRPQRTPV